MLLVAALGMAYVDLVGLPGPLKRPLLNELRAHGLDLQFSRLRLSWSRGVVAENVRFGATGQSLGPRLTAGEVTLLLDPHALLRCRIQVDSLALRQGRLVWPLHDPGANSAVLSLNEIQSNLSFSKDDTWTIENLDARFAGARIHLTGELSHASAVRTWGLLHGGKAPSAAVWQNRVHRLADILAQTQFSTPPEIQFDVRGDARNLHSLSLRMRLNAASAQSAWGAITEGRLDATLLPAANPQPARVTLSFQAGSARTGWVSAQGLRITAHLVEASPQPTRPQDGSWGWWTNAAPFVLDWQGEAASLESRNGLACSAVVLAGTCRAPVVAVTNLEAQLQGKPLHATAHLDVATRNLHATLESKADPHQLAPLLGRGAQAWLNRFSWTVPPAFTAHASLRLPPWTSPEGLGAWETEAGRTLSLSGQFQTRQGGAFDQIPFDSARSSFTYSNLCWRLQDLVVKRPEGVLETDCSMDGVSKQYTFRFHSTIDPSALSPLLPTNAVRAVALFRFSSPPIVDGIVRGAWNAPQSLVADGQMALTNFVFRDETFSGLQTAFQYTNRVLRFTAPRIQRGAERLDADAVTVDLGLQRVYLTNGFSTMDPGVVTRAIGPQVAHAIEPYHFSRPPTVRASGTIPIRKEKDADLHFHVEGGPFHWLEFNLPIITGDIYWKGLSLVLTNIDAGFYGGQATGSAAVDFRPPRGNDFEFSLQVQNALLESLMHDAMTRTNRLEGRLSGRLAVTHANTLDWRTVMGAGSLDLRDGLIWDIPLCGIFSPVLNGISPGLGSSRAGAATSDFTITNGVIHSNNLEVRSHAVRLRYRGTVDLQGQVNARVEGLLLRDVWLLGPVVSTVFWPVTKMFEYKLSGPLENPKTQPVFFVPKVVLFPFHPLHTLQGVLHEQPRTNAPPRFGPLPGSSN